jgi:choline-glycine betaine transporter
MSTVPEQVLDLAYQLPVACLLLIVVWKFLKSMKENQNDWLETVRRRDAQFLEQHKETVEVLRGNAVLLDKAATIMDKVDQKLTREAFERDHGVTRMRN